MTGNQMLVLIDCAENVGIVADICQDGPVHLLTSGRLSWADVVECHIPYLEPILICEPPQRCRHCISIIGR